MQSALLPAACPDAACILPVGLLFTGPALANAGLLHLAALPVSNMLLGLACAAHAW